LHCLLPDTGLEVHDEAFSPEALIGSKCISLILERGISACFKKGTRRSGRLPAYALQKRTSCTVTSRANTRGMLNQDKSQEYG
jgi:hypothetical protein